MKDVVCVENNLKQKYPDSNMLFKPPRVPEKQTTPASQLGAEELSPMQLLSTLTPVHMILSTVGWWGDPSPRRPNN